jgi:hypothetical protein
MTNGNEKANGNRDSYGMTNGIHNVCHAGSVSHNAGNAKLEIPTDPRAMLELPEAMTNEADKRNRQTKTTN